MKVEETGFERFTSVPVLTERGGEERLRYMECMEYADAAVGAAEAASKFREGRETRTRFGLTLYVWWYTPWDKDHWGEPYFVYEYRHHVPVATDREGLLAALTEAAFEVVKDE